MDSGMGVAGRLNNPLLNDLLSIKQTPLKKGRDLISGLMKHTLIIYYHYTYKTQSSDPLSTIQSAFHS